MSRWFQSFICNILNFSGSTMSGNKVASTSLIADGAESTETNSTDGIDDSGCQALVRNPPKSPAKKFHTEHVRTDLTCDSEIQNAPVNKLGSSKVKTISVNKLTADHERVNYSDFNTAYTEESEVYSRNKKDDCLENVASKQCCNGIEEMSFSRDAHNLEEYSSHHTIGFTSNFPIAEYANGNSFYDVPSYSLQNSAAACEDIVQPDICNASVEQVSDTSENIESSSSFNTSAAVSHTSDISCRCHLTDNNPESCDCEVIIQSSSEFSSTSFSTESSSETEDELESTETFSSSSYNSSSLTSIDEKNSSEDSCAITRDTSSGVSSHCPPCHEYGDSFSEDCSQKCYACGRSVRIVDFSASNTTDSTSTSIMSSPEMVRHRSRSSWNQRQDMLIINSEADTSIVSSDISCDYSASDISETSEDSSVHVCDCCRHLLDMEEQDTDDADYTSRAVSVAVGTDDFCERTPANIYPPRIIIIYVTVIVTV